MTKAKTLLLLAAGLLLLAQAPAHAQGNPPGVNPTHYWTYQLHQPFAQPQPILVQDQFFPAPMPVSVDHMDRLVNWVIKTDPATGFTSVPVDTSLHYTWWNIAEKLPVNQVVGVTNQFGSYPVTVSNLEFLLTPAYKNHQASVPFPTANHYSCYRATGFPPPGRPFLLSDEWHQDVEAPGPLEFLCAPCMKEHNGVTYPILDPVTHLALYSISPQSPLFTPLISDQFFFGPQLVQQLPVEYLLVPSTKQVVTDTKHHTWGQLKMLYR
jgi:hypothetical protein